MSTIYSQDFQASSSLPSGWNFDANFSIDTTSKVNGTNSLKNSTVATSNAFYATQDAANGFVRVSVAFRIDSPGTSSQMQLVALLSDPVTANFGTASCYRVGIAIGSSVTTWSIIRRNAGADTSIASANFATALSAATVYTAHLTVCGGNVSCEIQRASDSKWLTNGAAFQTARTACLFAADTSPLTGQGYSGLRFVVATGATVYGDDFLLENTQDVAANDSNWVQSPGNWDARSATAMVSQQPGAWLRIGFTGTSCLMNLDLTPYTNASLATADYPQIGYLVDDAGWTSVQLTQSVVTLAQGLANTTHYIQLALINTIKTDDRWNTPVSALWILGLSLDNGSASAPVSAGLAANTRRIAFCGDSISEGHRNLAAVSTIGGSDARSALGCVVAPGLTADAGIIGASGAGYLTNGQGNYPMFYNIGTPANSSYLYHSSGRSRSWAGITDVVCNYGVNDVTSPQTTVTAMIPALRAALDPGAKIWIVVDFNGRWSAELAAAVTAAGDSGTHLLDLGSYAATGLGTAVGTATKEAFDGLHPTLARTTELASLVAVDIKATEATGGTGGGIVWG